MVLIYGVNLILVRTPRAIARDARERVFLVNRSDPLEKKKLMKKIEKNLEQTQAH